MAEKQPARRAAAVAVAMGIFFSRIAGLVRERLFAHYLGNSVEAGAFKAALRIPNLLQNLLGEGALSASFIPVYSRLLGVHSAETDARAEALAARVGSLLALVVLVLTALGVLLAGPMTRVIAPGFALEVQALTVQLVRIIFAGVGLLVLSAYCLGVLNSHRRFFLSYVAPVLWNAAQIGALIYFGQAMAGRASDLVVALAWATLAGSGLQLLVQLPSTIRLLAAGRPSVSLTPEVREVLRNFGPALIGRGVVQISAFVDQALVSFLSAGMTAAMAYAQQIYLLPISLFGMAISASELPELSRSVGVDGRPNEEQARALIARLDRALGRLGFFVVPSAIACAALGDRIVGLLFQTGAFKRSDTVSVWMILIGASVGLVAATRARLYSSALYALSDTRAPLRFALVRVVLGGIVGATLAFPVRRELGLDDRFGAAALTLASALAGWLEYFLLRRHLLRRLDAKTTPKTEWEPWLAAACAAGVAVPLGRMLNGQPLLLWALVPLACFAAVYGLLCVLLGVEQARALAKRVLRR